MSDHDHCPKCGSVLEMPQVEEITLDNGRTAACRGVRISHVCPQCHITLSQVVEAHPGGREPLPI